MDDPNNSEQPNKNLIIKNNITNTPIRRGDGFDIGEVVTDDGDSNSDNIINIIQNPNKLVESFGLSDKQAENVKALLIGAGTATSNKLFSKYIGDELSAVVGAAISSHVIKKIIKPRNDNK